MALDRGANLRMAGQLPSPRSNYEISPRTSEAWINLRTFISDSVFWLAKIVQKSIEEFAILIRMKLSRTGSFSFSPSP